MGTAVACTGLARKVRTQNEGPLADRALAIHRSRPHVASRPDDGAPEDIFFVAKLARTSAPAPPEGAERAVYAACMLRGMSIMLGLINAVSASWALPRTNRCSMLATDIIPACAVSGTFRIALVFHDQVVRGKSSRDAGGGCESHDEGRESGAVLLVSVRSIRGAALVHRKPT